MKRLLAVILAALLLSVSLSVISYAEGNKAEIEFSVGDDTLIINGAPVTVEKPYVVGVGVTLVPIRVITEAFGAKVDWEGETKTVTVDYPGVNIVLRIGDITAEVNGRAEKLLAAPELTANGYTMIPLRFISENFGADVSYDNDTARIKVTLSDGGSGTTVSETITNKYVGDSYYGWSMENLSDFHIVDRAFDGTLTYFDYNDDNWFSVRITPMYEDYDFEKDFAETKGYAQGYTLVRADKDTSDYTKKSYRVQARDKSEFVDIKTIVTAKYIFTLFGDFENDKTDVKNEYLSKADTFDAVYGTDDIYDLSNVTDGFRRFTAENLNLSFDVFADYMMLSDEDLENCFSFGKYSEENTTSIIDFNVYSKDSAGGAEQLAKDDYNLNKETTNESIVYFENVKQNTYKNFTAYEYSSTINARYYKVWAKDVFFEKGDYVYNVTIGFMASEESKEALADRILNSIELSEIDADKVGKLLRNNPEYTGTFSSSKLNRCTVTLPNSYVENAASSNAVQYYNQLNGIVITGAYVYQEGTYTLTQLRQLAKDYETKNKGTAGVESVVKLKDETLNKNDGYMYTVSIDDNDEKTRVYVDNYFVISRLSDEVYVFSVQYPELSYSAKARKEVKEILNSIVFK